MPVVFEADYPRRVFAVYELNRTAHHAKVLLDEEVQYDGSYDLFEKLVKASKQRVTMEALLEAAKGAVESSAVTGHSLASVILSYPSHLIRIEPETELAKLVHEVQTKGDYESRLRMIMAATSLKGRSPVSKEMFDTALRDEDPLVRLAGMQGRLSFSKRDVELPVEQIQLFVDALNKLLANDKMSPIDMLKIALNVADRRATAHLHHSRHLRHDRRTPE